MTVQDEIKRYFENLAKMREEQQNYFKFKDAQSLAEAKRLERIIDRQTPRISNMVLAMMKAEP